MARTTTHNERRQKIVADACRIRVDGKPLPSLTIARHLYAKHPKLFTTEHAARCAVAYQRGNMGEGNRKTAKDKSQFRPNGSQSDRCPLPKSLAKEWVPYVLKARRILVLGDIHIPYHDERALGAAIGYGVEFSPDAILINGDMLDFEGISRYDKPPGPTVKTELQLGREFLAGLHKVFPKAKKVLKRGNHEDRWNTYFWRKAIELEELCRDVWQHFLGVADYGVDVVGDKRIIMCGKLPVLHGHEFKGGATSPVNPARGAALKAKHTVLIHHHHQTSTQPINNVFHDESFAWSVGCLCGLNPDYMPINEWNHGFATIEVAANGDFDVENLRIKDGKVRKS